MLVEQPGLTSQGLSPVDHAHGERTARATARRLHAVQFRTHAVQFHDVARDAAGEQVGLELSLDGDATVDGVQTPREAQDGGEFGHPSRGTRVADRGQLGLHIGGGRHSDPSVFRWGEERPAYSRPRSRCFTRTATPGTSASRPASSIAVTTERCLPPVHPTATTECRLFSRW